MHTVAIGSHAFTISQLVQVDMHIAIDLCEPCIWRTTSDQEEGEYCREQ
jgi:hypothetical protein